MDRSDRISALERLKNRTLSTATVDWIDVCRNIKNGTVLPVIGNALRNDGIFDWYFKARRSLTAIKRSKLSTITWLTVGQIFWNTR
jgi:hypothetical protein